MTSAPPPPAEPRSAPPGGREGVPRWPAWAPFAAMLIAFGIALLGVSVIALGVEVAGAHVDAGDPPPGVTIGGTFIQDAGLIFSAVLIAWLTAGRPRPSEFGLRPVAPVRAAGWLAAVWVAFLIFSAVWAAALNVTQSDDLPKELGAENSHTALAAVTVLVCVAAPIAEELFFRGFCFTALRRWLGLVPGAIITGAIFGLIHASSAAAVFLVPLAVFGIGLCVLYHRTGSLLPCMVLHAFNNALALGVTQKWGAGEIVLLMVGAAAVVLAIAAPFARGGDAGPLAPQPAG